jgi:hypothetical protein
VTTEDRDFLKIVEKKLNKTIDEAIELTATYKVDKNVEQSSWVRIAILIAVKDVVKVVREALEEDGDVPDR